MRSIILGTILAILAASPLSAQTTLQTCGLLSISSCANANFQSVQDELNAANNKIDALTKQVGTIAAQLDAANGKIDALTNQVGTVATLSKQIDDLTARVDSLKTSLDAANAELANPKTGLGALGQALATESSFTHGNVQLRSNSHTGQCLTYIDNKPGQLGFAGCDPNFHDQDLRLDKR